MRLTSEVDHDSSLLAHLFKFQSNILVFPPILEEACWKASKPTIYSLWPGSSSKSGCDAPDDHATFALLQLWGVLPFLLTCHILMYLFDLRVLDQVPVHLTASRSLADPHWSWSYLHLRPRAPVALRTVHGLWPLLQPCLCLSGVTGQWLPCLYLPSPAPFV